MENLVERLQEEAIKKRLFAVEEVKQVLVRGNIIRENWKILVEPLVSVLRDNNFKICKGSLECIDQLMQQVGTHFQPYASLVFPAVVDKLGDSKEAVRNQSVKVLMSLARIAGADFVLGRLEAHYSHKNWRVREQLLVVVSEAAKEYGKSVIGVAVLDMLIQSMEDSSSDVRQQAVATAALAYTILGNKFMEELELRGIRTSVLHQIRDKIQYQEVSGKGKLQVDVSSKPRPVSAPSSARTSPTAPGSGRSSSRPKSTSLRRNASQNSQGEADGMTLEVEAIDGEQIAPVEVHTEKEMLEKLEGVRAALGEAQDDNWQVRLSALQMLHGIALGGATTYSSFVPQVRQLVGAGVESQLGDLRSQIVKEACRAVTALATATGDSFAPLAELWLPALLKLVPQTIRVMSSSGDRCAKAIMISSHNGFPKVLPILLASYSSKNPTVRVHAITYIMIALAHWNVCTIERHFDSIVEMLRLAVVDADARARAKARVCFWALHHRSQSHAETLMAEVDLPTQRRLLQDEAGASKITIVQVGPALSPAAAAGPKGPKNACSKEPRRSTGPSTCPPERGGAKAAVTGAMRVAVPAVGTEDPQISCRQPLPDENNKRKPPATNAGPVRVASAATNRVPASTNKLENKADKEKKIGAVRRVVPSQPMQIANQKQPTTERFHQSSGANSSSLGGGAARIVVPAREEKQQKPVQKEFRSKRQSTLPQRVALPNESNEIQDGNDKGNVSKTIGAMRIQQPTDDDVEMQEEDSAEESVTKPRVCEDEVLDQDFLRPRLIPLKHLIRMAENEHWATRLESFQGFMMLLEEDPASLAGEKANGKAMISLVIQHMLDKHHKVSLAALATLGVLVESSPALLQTSKSDILPKVFTKLADPKPQIRQEANGLLTKLRQTFDISEVCGSICPHLMDFPDKARCGALEFLTTLCPSAPPYLMAPQNLRGLIQRLTSMAHVSSRGSQMLQESALKLLLALQHMDPRLFEAQIASLPDQAQARAQDVLKKHLTLPAKVTSQSSQQTKPHPTRIRKGAANPVPPASRRRVSNLNLTVVEMDCDLENEHNNHSYSDKSNKDVMQGQKTADDPKSDRLPLSEITSTVENHPPLVTAPDHYTRKEPHAGEECLGLGAPIISVGPLLQALGAGSATPGQSQRLLAMRQIVQLSKENNPEIWSKYFSQILLLLLEGLRGANRDRGHETSKGLTKLRQSSLLTLSSMILCQGKYFVDFMEIVFDSLMECCRDPCFEIVHTSEMNLERLVQTLHPERCFAVLIPYIQQNSIEPVQLSSIKILCKLLPRTPSPFLVQQLPCIIPCLTAAFSSQNAEIRKAVVYAFVEIHLILGDGLFPHLDDLTSTQKKLVTIYINKRNQQVQC